jgi:hypothetical protein
LFTKWFYFIDLLFIFLNLLAQLRPHAFLLITFLIIHFSYLFISFDLICFGTYLIRFIIYFIYLFCTRSLLVVLCAAQGLTLFCLLFIYFMYSFDLFNCVSYFFSFFLLAHSRLYCAWRRASCFSAYYFSYHSFYFISLFVCFIFSFTVILYSFDSFFCVFYSRDIYLRSNLFY